MHVWLSQLGIAAAIGIGLGVWFFGGLLWTVRHLSDFRHPVLLAITSFLVRTAVVAAGMLWLVRRHWLLPIVALAAFLAVRGLVLTMWAARRPQANVSRLP